jgi:hypothetical protein
MPPEDPIYPSVSDPSVSGPAVADPSLSDPSGSAVPVDPPIHRPVARSRISPSRSSPQTSSSGGPLLLHIAFRIQPRDAVLARLLDEHAVLTTDQITALLFTNPRTCRNRLDLLRRAGFVGRFTPAVGPGGADPIAPPTHDRPAQPDSASGSHRSHGAHGRARSSGAGRTDPPRRRRASVGAVSHWVAGPAAARWTALASGRPAPTAKSVRDRQDSLAASTHLAHTVGVNQFFVDLIAYSRTHPGTRLTRWWSATRTAAAYGRLIRPDGHGVWRTTSHHHPGDQTDGQIDGLVAGQGDGDVREVGFFLEHDTGTESHRQLTAKLAAYQRLRARGGPDLPVLFWLPTKARESNLHHHLADLPWAGLTIATAARDHAADAGGPAAAVWRIAGNGRHRLTLADLPANPDGTGAFPVGSPPPEDDPLHLPAPSN